MVFNVINTLLCLMLQETLRESGLFDDSLMAMNNRRDIINVHIRSFWILCSLKEMVMMVGPHHPSFPRRETSFSSFLCLHAGNRCRFSVHPSCSSLSRERLEGDCLNFGPHGMNWLDFVGQSQCNL